MQCVQAVPQNPGTICMHRKITEAERLQRHPREKSEIRVDDDRGIRATHHGGDHVTQGVNVAWVPVCILPLSFAESPGLLAW
jgi:hypothetical protein